MPRILPLLASFSPTAALAHSGPHLHPHGAELPVLALAALATAVAVAAVAWGRK